MALSDQLAKLAARAKDAETRVAEARDKARTDLEQEVSSARASARADAESLRQAVFLVSNLPPLSGIVRDPNDDMILACAVAASASHVVTRDPDLLSLDTYEGITIVTPEAILALLRGL